MEPPYPDTERTITERNYEHFVAVCARISQAEDRPPGQAIPIGKLEKLFYERSRLRILLGSFFADRT